VAQGTASERDFKKKEIVGRAAEGVLKVNQKEREGGESLNKTNLEKERW